MSKQQTAVEWLQEQLNPDMKTMQGHIIQDLLDQAKAMEKEQIIDACIYGPFEDLAEDYYNKTYESNGSDDHLPDVREMVEISDEEITKLANEYILYNDSKRQWVIEGMKLYREQLKQK